MAKGRKRLIAGWTLVGLTGMLGVWLGLSPGRQTGWIGRHNYVLIDRGVLRFIYHPNPRGEHERQGWRRDPVDGETFRWRLPGPWGMDRVLESAFQGRSEGRSFTRLGLGPLGFVHIFDDGFIVGWVVGWPLTLLPLVIALPLFASLARTRRKIRNGRCPACGYDLSATPTIERCPECGGGRGERQFLKPKTPGVCASRL